ncbi:MAG: hypothetical protein HY815_15055 [Candidatus Riflebacteria bacterium]|nr:hypothetical protein [Candidatus Riflebacteria bacterium]
MGGSYYSGDVTSRSTSTNAEAFDSAAGSATAARGRVHADLDPLGRTLTCPAAPGVQRTPVVVAMDVTRSRGEDAKIVYGKLPMFIGQICMKNYVPHPQVSFAAIGDATCDKAPLQVGPFAADNSLDDVLTHMWLEEGGGGTGQESYELAAYYFARHVDLQCLGPGQKGFFFFIGDEGFYPGVSRQQVKSVIGDALGSDLRSAEIFAELAARFHVFFIYPRKSWEQRKSDIDAEIRQRVLAAGGQYDGVDIRASLLWNNRNDLDLHVITPRGFHIYFGDKRSPCGGWLDVDMNVSGETTKPVENVRWKRGEAPRGKYQVFVRNYRFHEDRDAATEFKVELEVNGQIQHVTGRTAARITGDRSEVLVAEFEYDPDARVRDPREEGAPDAYAGYDDAHIKNQWSAVIPPENLLTIDDPKAIIDVLLGALAIAAGTRDLDEYLVDMKGRGQTALRQEETRRALANLHTQNALVKVDSGALTTGRNPGKVRKGKTRRI